MDTQHFEFLNEDEKKEFMDGLKTYLGYEREIKETRESQKAQVKLVSDKVPSLSAKEIRKYFVYFKKNITPTELREDAEVIERIKQDFPDSFNVE